MPALRISQSVFDAIKRYHLDASKGVERLSYVFGRRVSAGGDITILVPPQAPVLFGSDCFVHQSGGGVTLDPAVLNGMLVEVAASDWDTIVNVHDHWFSAGGTRFSGIDDADDLRFGDYLVRRFEPMLARNPQLGAPRQITLASVVLDRTSLDARIVRSGAVRPFVPADNIQIVGDRLCVERCNSSPAEEPLPDLSWLARHDDFVPVFARNALASVRVALVGCGGLGSVLAEGLVRTGVHDLVLIDPDRLEESNLNRWQGGRTAGIGRLKAELLAERIRDFAPAVRALPIAESLHASPAIDALKTCALIIGGVDNDFARYTLNRFAAQYLTPYFDAGVRVAVSGGVDFQTRCFCVSPGTTGCLECTRSNLLDREALAAAMLDPTTRQARTGTGYVINAPEPGAPSVYALNLRASSILLTELLNYFSGFRPSATTCYDSWRNDLARRFDASSFEDRPAEDCPNCSFYLGRGDLERLPIPGVAQSSSALFQAAEELRSGAGAAE